MRLREVFRSIQVLLSCLFKQSYYYVNAANRGDVAAVQRYLRSGVAVDVKSLGEMTAMRWACFQGHEEVVRVLLAHGADPSGGLLEARQMHRQNIMALLRDAGAKG
jgi:ankyrin repeat protein